MQMIKYWTQCAVIFGYTNFEIVTGLSITIPKFKKRNFYKIGTRTLKPNVVNSSEYLFRVPNHVIKTCSAIPEESTASIFSATECASDMLNQILFP